jgi:hypothetical protein
MEITLGLVGTKYPVRDYCLSGPWSLPVSPGLKTILLSPEVGPRNKQVGEFTSVINPFWNICLMGLSPFSLSELHRRQQ